FVSSFSCWGWAGSWNLISFKAFSSSSLTASWMQWMSAFESNVCIVNFVWLRQILDGKVKKGCPTGLVGHQTGCFLEGLILQILSLSFIPIFRTGLSLSKPSSILKLFKAVPYLMADPASNKWLDRIFAQTVWAVVS